MATIDKHTGKMISGIPAIRQAIDTILRTSQGERVMRREFGITFQNPDGTAKDGLTPEQVRKECAAALLKYEPRITLKSVDPIFVGSGLKSVSVTYLENETEKDDTVIIEYTTWEPQ